MSVLTSLKIIYKKSLENNLRVSIFISNKLHDFDLEIHYNIVKSFFVDRKRPIDTFFRRRLRSSLEQGPGNNEQRFCVSKHFSENVFETVQNKLLFMTKVVKKNSVK